MGRADGSYDKARPTGLQDTGGDQRKQFQLSHTAPSAHLKAAVSQTEVLPNVLGAR